MQLVVLGMHRSGTSVLARMLNLMGAYFGAEGTSTGANRENPKGFWERRDVRVLNDGVLWSENCDWNRVSAFDPHAVKRSTVDAFEKHASRILLDMDAHRPWLLKEPRLCLLLPLWRRLLEVPVCIHILRNPVEVASSLRTRNQIPIEAGLALWERYSRDAISASSGLTSIRVLHRQLIEDPRAAAERLFRQLSDAGVSGLRLPAKREIASFVQDDLYREREGTGDLKRFAGASQVALFERWSSDGFSEQDALDRISDEARQALRDYEDTLPPFEARPHFLPPVSQEAMHQKALAEKEAEIASARECITGLESDLASGVSELALAKSEVNLLRERLADQSHQQSERVLEIHARSVDAVQRLSENLDQRNRHALEDLKQDMQRRHREELAKAAETGRALEQQAQALALEVQGLEQRLGERSREIALLTMMVVDLESEKEQAAAREKRLGKDLDAAAAKAALLESESEARIAFLAERIVDAEKETDALRSDLRLSAEKLAASQSATQACRRQLRDRDVELKEKDLLASQAARKAEQLQESLDSVLSSFSWKAGAPIRWLRAPFRGRSTGSQADRDEDASLLRSSQWFDASWYRRRYPDVVSAKADPVIHYLVHGAAEGRDPGPAFSGDAYLKANADVAREGVNPLVHYLRHGAAEGRGVSPSAVKDEDNV